jgi:hypothetical protein
MVENMNQDLKNVRQDSGRACDSRDVERVLEFNGLWQDECYRNWFDSGVEK